VQIAPAADDRSIENNKFRFCQPQTLIIVRELQVFKIFPLRNWKNFVNCQIGACLFLKDDDGVWLHLSKTTN
jgi:hypothetical protein